MTVSRRILTLLLCCLMLAFSLPVSASATGGISGLVFEDAKADGLYADGEDLIGGASISLIKVQDGQEQVVATQETDHTGAFSFQGLAAGDYFLRFSYPGGFVPTRYLKGGSIGLPSSESEGRSAPITLAEGEQSSVYLGVILRRVASFVRAVAFGDDNLNGGRFSSEPLLRDVQLELLFELDGVFYQVGTDSTDRDGIGEIRNVAPGGPYVLGATMPGNYIIGPLGQKVNLFYNVIIPAEGNYGRSAPFDLPVSGSLGVAVGGAITGSAQGMAWQDTNMNGRKDANEPGAAGVRITLTHLTMGVERDLLTDESGVFRFPALQPGEYTLAASLPEGQMFTLPGGDSVLSSDLEATAQKTITVNREEETALGGIGLIPVTSLTLQAFHDSNLNGQLDEGELPFAGAKLEALKGAGVLGSAVTDANGVGTIPLLRGQDMELRVTLPDGQIFSVQGEEGGNAFSANTAESSLTIPYSLKPGEASTVLAGATLPGQISGQLFDDMNSNALLDGGEQPVPGFTVQALNANGEVVAEVQTDANGNYLFPALIPGTYELRLLLQSPYIFSGAPTSTGAVSNKYLEQTAEYGLIKDVQVQPGALVSNMDAAIFRSGVVEGSVLLGDEQDSFAGKQGGLEGVLVELMDEDGQPVSEYTVATTDAQGRFLLKGALPGTYSLRYTLPENAAFSQPLTDEQNILTATFPVQAADEIEAEAIYAVKTGTLSGRAYIDSNVNGTWDAGDRPLQGVDLQMQSATAANSRGATSTENGTYTINMLRPGDYRLQVTLPDGMLVSFDQQSPLSPAISNSNSVDVQIGMGETKADQQVAVLPTQALSGALYFDDNLDGERSEGEPGVPALELRLRHNLSKVEFTSQADQEGNYAIPVLFPGDYSLTMALPEDMELFAPAGAKHNAGTYELAFAIPTEGTNMVQNLGLVQFGSLSGQVWNMGGSMENVANLPLTLAMEDGSHEMKATTDTQGNYRFERLYPGSYRLGLQLVTGYRFARQIDSEQTRFSLITSDGSDVQQHVGRSLAFPLKMAEHLDKQDIGMGTTGQLGDYAWLDTDGDGMQDAGEPGVPGIQIRLYQYGQQVAEGVTDAYGRYLFKELYPGQYRVEVTMPPELKATKHQTEFRLVASILPEEPGVVVSAEEVTVPSAGRNLNADFGFQLVRENVLPDSLKTLPQKDWTPLVPTVPKRLR